MRYIVNFVKYCTFNSSKYILFIFRFFTEIASDCEIFDPGNHSLSFINDANVIALHRLLWNNQEKIGDYLSSSRYRFDHNFLLFVLVLLDEEEKPIFKHWDRHQIMSVRKNTGRQAVSSVNTY